MKPLMSPYREPSAPLTLAEVDWLTVCAPVRTAPQPVECTAARTTPLLGCSPDGGALGAAAPACIDEHAAKLSPSVIRGMASRRFIFVSSEVLIDSGAYGVSEIAVVRDTGFRDHCQGIGRRLLAR